MKYWKVMKEWKLELTDEDPEIKLRIMIRIVINATVF